MWPWSLLTLQQNSVPETEIKMYLESRTRPAREADSFTDLCEPIV
jgi:hypothetical protein